MKKYLLLSIFLTLLSTACDSGRNISPEICDPSSFIPSCIENTNAITACKDNTLKVETCPQHTTCKIQADNTAKCTSVTQTPNTDPQIHCTTQDNKCLSSSLLQQCTNNNFHFISCEQNQICQNAKCIDKEQVSCTPNDPPLCINNEQLHCKDGEKTWIPCAKNQTCKDGVCKDIDSPIIEKCTTSCSQDGKSITLCENDTPKTISCRELTGIDSNCREFSKNHHGCEMPQTCTPQFTEKGKCMGNKMLVCQNNKPFILDCEALNQICTDTEKGAFCTRTCTELNPEPTCKQNSQSIYQLESCIKKDEKTNIIKVQETTCKDLNNYIHCSENGQTQISKCLDSEICNPNLGYCTKTCTNIGEFQCDDTQTLFQCQDINGEKLYVKQPRRICDSDTLTYCIKDKDKNEIVLRRANCRTDMQHQGKHIEARCVSEFIGFSGTAMCVPVEKGDPCPPEITEQGICEGNILKSCNKPDNVLNTFDCSTSKINHTQCATINGYSDCYQPCSEENTAFCKKEHIDGQYTYILSMCMKAQNSDKLVRVQGNNICYGDIQVSCSEDGKVQRTNCSELGGYCNVNICNFPLCKKDSNAYCQNNETLKKCITSTNANLIGEITNKCGQVQSPNSTHACLSNETTSTCVETCTDTQITSLGKCIDNTKLKRCKDGETITEQCGLLTCKQDPNNPLAQALCI